eukprot:5608385-Pleurochrysis_carterae.AAC.2
MLANVDTRVPNRHAAEIWRITIVIHLDAVQTYSDRPSGSVHQWTPLVLQAAYLLQDLRRCARAD